MPIQGEPLFYFGLRSKIPAFWKVKLMGATFLRDPNYFALIDEQSPGQSFYSPPPHQQGFPLRQWKRKQDCPNQVPLVQMQWEGG